MDYLDTILVGNGEEYCMYTTLIKMYIRKMVFFSRVFLLLFSSFFITFLYILGTLCVYIQFSFIPDSDSES